MGKPKRSTNISKNSGPVDTSDEEYSDTVDPSASEFVYDAVDEYYENEEREAAEKLAKLMKRKKKNVEHDILGVASSSDEEESFKKSSKKKKLKKKSLNAAAEPLPPLDIDLNEEEDEEEEESMEWGKKKSAYYNADYVDEDLDEGDESNVEVAELEEQEALKIQKKLVAELDEADYGLDFITHLKAASQVKKPASAEEEKIDVNLSQLSKREKLKLLTEESPELLELVEDFKYQMTELKTTLQPLLKLVAQEILPSSPAVDYLKARYQLILNYCTQIGYYFVLKSKRISVQNHPVVKRLVQFRSLLHQLETAGKSLQPEIDDLLEKTKSNQKLSQENFVRTIVPPKKKLRILSKRSETDKPKETQKEKKNVSVTKKKTETLTRDEANALEFYKAVRGSKKSSKDDDTSDEEAPPDMDVSGAEASDNATQDDDVEKRGINYQIAKNKGLTPHRSKEQRNPRVKHRMKFRKAKIRRKGQIREPRKELQKYGGEISGIKATVVRSVKLK